MPWTSLQLNPTVDVVKTPAANMAGVSESSFIRWRNGMPEKRGGWAKFMNTNFPNPIKSLHAWQDANARQWLGVATTNSLSAVNSGTVYNITPQSTTTSFAPDFTTSTTDYEVTIGDAGSNLNVYDTVVFLTPVSVGGICLKGMYDVSTALTVNSYKVRSATLPTSAVVSGGAVAVYATVTGTATVTVTLANHGFVVGSYYPAMISTTVGGIPIFGQYQIKTVPTANTFTFDCAIKATATASASINGGNVAVVYYIAQGAPILGTGYGIDAYGQAATAGQVSYYGTGVAQTTQTATGTNLSVTDYMLDNWGELLIASPKGQPVFVWSPQEAGSTAGPIANGPVANQGACVVMPMQMLMCWGSTYNLISDPLQIRWSDSGDYTVWQPMAINQAGGFRIPTGSQIIRIKQVTQQVLIWTDIDCYSAQYVGPPFVWGFSKIADGCGLIGPHAVASQAASVYWMSQKQFFYKGDGGIQAIPCPVWDAIFQNINTTYAANVVAASNSQYNEITWFYPSQASTTGANDSYVTYNIQSQSWDIGQLPRCAWIDQSVLGPPIGASSDGYIYQHEISPDADGGAINASLSTGYFTLSEGEDFMFIDYIQADARWQKYGDYLAGTGQHVGSYIENEGGTLKFTFNVRDYMWDDPRVYGPYTINARVGFIPCRFRGRYIQIKVESADLGTWWRLQPSVKIRYAPDGRR